MSDDLVKRLRDTPNWMREGFQDWKDNVRTYDRAPFEAADRIEELQNQVNGLLRQASDTHDALSRAETAEAKLEKAVYAMEVWLQAQEPDIDIAIKLMHDTLTELKGQTDE